MSSPEVNAVYSFYLEASRDPLTGGINPILVLARSLQVQKNAGVQLVFPNLVDALNRAMRFKPKLRGLLMSIAVADIGGIVALGGEGGVATKEINTSRQNIPIGQLEGQEYTWWDKLAYEGYLGQKGKFKHNKEKDLTLIE